jgi:hypothetical protein
MKLLWLLSVRGKLGSNRIADEGGEFRGFGILLLFAQAHVRHLTFEKSGYFPQCLLP